MSFEIALLNNYLIVGALLFGIGGSVAFGPLVDDAV